MSISADVEPYTMSPGAFLARGDVSHHLSASGLARLRRRIDDAVLTAAGKPSADPLLSEVIEEAVTAFVRWGTRPTSAAMSIAGLLERIGEREAHAGCSAEALALRFDHARTAAQRGLSAAFSDVLTADQLTGLRQDLTVYLHQLHEHARRGFERRSRLLALPQRHRDDLLHLALFERSDGVTLRSLIPAAGLDAQTPMVAVVSCSVELPKIIRTHAETISARSALEALVPAAWVPERLAEALHGQAVIGPTTPLADAGEAVGLARRAADALREQRVSDRRRVVPCADLLGELLIDTDRLLSDLLIAKHLSGLEAMTRQRRLSLGEFLLHWLERGVPINQLARELGIPPQTAHSRMKTVRSMYSSALDDPRERLELIAALRAALPRWRAATS